MRKTQKKQENPTLLSAGGAPNINWTYCGALLPAAMMSVYFFGIAAIQIILICIVSSLLFEAGLQWFLKQRITVRDGDAFLTGLLLGLTLSPGLSPALPILGAFTAIVVAKHLFIISRGSILFHPVLFGKAVLLIIFPASMAAFHEPAAAFSAMEAKTAATPLTVLKQEGMGRLLEIYHTKADLYIDLLLGNRPGNVGETCVAALLLAGAFLLMKRIITWHIPVAFIATLAILTWIFGGKEGLLSGDPIFHVLSGGAILAAFFIATDPRTSPRAGLDKVFFGIGCGLLTTLFRLKSVYSEGVMFAVLIMNCAVPLLYRRTHRIPSKTIPQ